MSTPCISVVVPLYNKRPYIRRCLESIRSQTVTGFEAIVVDDGSTDGGGGAVAEIADSRFQLIVQPNGGEAAARNRGIAAARSGIVAFLDADDEWLPQFLEAVLALALRYPEAGLFATGIRRRRAGEPDRETTLPAAGGRGFVFSDYLERVQEGDFVTSSSVALRRAAFAAVGGFPEGEHIGGDVDLWARVSLRFPFAYDPRILAVYHSEAAGRSFDRWQHAPPYPPLVRTFRRMLAENQIPADKLRHVQECIDLRLLKHAYWLLQLRRRADLIRLLRTERFACARHRLEAALLCVGAALLPLRAVSAIRYKPANLKAALTRRARDGWTGCRVLSRTRSQVPGPC